MFFAHNQISAYKQRLHMEPNLRTNYQTVRAYTEYLCKPLAIEDYVIQSIEDTSPPKWHLAHTTWFFETFVLMPHLKNYRQYNPIYQSMFNSYYQQIGVPFPRDKRGVLSRPTVSEIINYRRHVDECLLNLTNINVELAALITLGLHHEQQHQELLLTDIKHNFSMSPEFPIYAPCILSSSNSSLRPIQYIAMGEGVFDIGHEGDDFCFDNETPRHQQILKPFAIADRLTTNEEYIEFILAGGYREPLWWLSDGWDYVLKNNWQAPHYWYKTDNQWSIFTLHGLQALDPHEPVVHMSYYEADAYARFRNCRLPTEAEWEIFVCNHNVPLNGNLLEKQYHHPQAIRHDTIPIKILPQQVYGDVWEWTSSPYCPYPGYKATRNALGEYNGKFMSNQMVLRGGSCVTPESHIRASYRNFFQPEKRWQFVGIRLAKDIE